MDHSGDNDLLFSAHLCDKYGFRSGYDIFANTCSRSVLIVTETLARWVGNYLTKSSGVKVVFESAIVPKWKDGVITFKNVFVSRRPGQGSGNVSKGSSKTAAAAAAAALGDAKDRPNTHGSVQREGAEHGEEDTNYTQFDVSIDTVNVTLSFTKWLNGKGLLGDVEVKGIRGVIDRAQVHWTNDNLDPKSYRHEHNPGDFEIDSFKMEDVLVTIYQPNNFRPFSVSIFSCDLPQLRKQWLFYDFLSANMMSGSFDNSLFTIHPRQTHNYTGVQLSNGVEENGESSPWKKQNRFRIDGLNIDHLNRGVEGPFSWIHEGTVDIVADIMFPADNDESLAKVVSDFYDRLEATVTSTRYPLENSKKTREDETDEPTFVANDNDKRFLVTDLRIHLNNVRAVVPLFTRDLSYINNALIRPIVAYINSRRTFIPVNCRLVKRLSDFDGSWTIFDSGMMDDLSAAVSIPRSGQTISRYFLANCDHHRHMKHLPETSSMNRRASAVSRRSASGHFNLLRRLSSWAWQATLYECFNGPFGLSGVHVSDPGGSDELLLRFRGFRLGASSSGSLVLYSNFFPFLLYSELSLMPPRGPRGFLDDCGTRNQRRSSSQEAPE
jgi:distribution and morphology protein 31